MSISYKNREYPLNTFRVLNYVEDSDRENFISTMKRRIGRIIDGAYIYADALCLLEEQVPYSLNIDEFWHHMFPFVNKIFVVFLTNLITGRQQLVYAANICVPNQSSCKKFMTDYEDVSSALLDVFTLVPEDRLNNLVAVVTDRNRLNLKALSNVAYILEHNMPPVVFDATHLIAKCNEENDAFCVETINSILSTQFSRETFKTELREIRSDCRSGNYETLLPMWSFCRETKKMLKRVFKTIPHSTFSAHNLRNDQLEAYGKGAVRQMPFLDRELCAEAGMVYFLSYEVAMEINHKPALVVLNSEA